VEQISILEKFLCSPFRQQVEIQEVVHAAGYTTLRVRIREGKRFTIIDIDAKTAEIWGRVLNDWARRQPAEAAPQGEIPSAG
jgi:hypothetical protein